jgi:hypothetical protein
MSEPSEPVESLKFTKSKTVLKKMYEVTKASTNIALSFFPDGTSTTSVYFYITMAIIIIILLVLFGWIYDRLDLEQRSCAKLEKYYTKSIGRSYFTGLNTVVVSVPSTKNSVFDASDSILQNYYVKSAYNCCCGDGYKNNFVNLCALEKSIKNGCRFLDFEIYSYNNEPIIASSTANNNYIKETYNSLRLDEVLSTITSKAFNAINTNCYRDPLILNFRIMSTNLTMLEKIGILFEQYLEPSSGGNDTFKLIKQHNYTTGTITKVKMLDLYKTIIIICDFYPSNNILETNVQLSKLKQYINLKGKGEYCKTYRYNEIIGKKNRFIDETKRSFTIVLPTLNNLVNNDEFASSYGYGCNAIAMKYQTLDPNLIQYNKQFENAGNYSWILKPNHLITNVPTRFAIIPFTSHAIDSNVTQSISDVLSGRRLIEPLQPPG